MSQLNNPRAIVEQKRVETDLRKSEDKFSKAFHQAPLILGISNLKDGRYVDVNDTFYRVLGFERDEVIGRTSSELNIWENAADRQKILESIRNKIPVRDMEVGLRSKQGKRILCNTFVEQIEVENEPCLLVICEDITERKKTENALLSSEQQYRTLTQGLPVIVYRVYLGEPHRTEFFNDVIFSITGYQKNELLPGEISSIDPLMVPQDRMNYTEIVAQALALNQPFEVDYRIKNKNDEIRSCVERGRPVIGENGETVYIDGIISDVTDKKKAEQAIMDSETRYRTLVETMSQGVIYTDSTGRLFFANPAALNILGITFEQFQTRIYQEGHQPIKEDGTEFKTDEHPSILALKTGITHNGIIMGVYNPRDKARRWISVDAVPQFHPGEKTPCLVYSTFSDITEIKKAQQQLLEIETLKRTDQAKSELLANVSHELRTPLTTIKGNIETLLETDVKWSKKQQLEFLTEANQQADVLTKLIRDLLDMSRLDSGKSNIEKQDCTLDEVLQEATAGLGAVTQKHDLNIKISDGLPGFKADKARLARVLVNLVENASKFSAEGSMIKIEAAVKDNDLIIRVIDQGIGMNTEAVSKLFNRFYQVEQVVTGKTRGTGLGLAICKGIVEAHGGQIWAESQEGRGSIFGFTIPLEKVS